MRNAIERIFGILKRRFPIFKTAPEYSIITQAKLVLAVTALHNFISNHTGDATENAIEASFISNLALDEEEDEGESNISQAVIASSSQGM